MTPVSKGASVAKTVIDVRSPELDSFGHVNHAVFLTYLEHARFEAMQQAGFSWDVLDERGWKIFVVRCEVDYVSEARRGDRLIVRTWMDSFRRTSMKFAQEIVRSDDQTVVVTRSLVTAVWVGTNRHPMRVPDMVRSGLLAMAPPAEPTANET
jgi:YbgC/YbaW family acyl-CoA thioester hydrolase